MATRRLYYDDAFEKEFTARVMHCEVLPPDVKSGITDRVWGLILDRTAFYPTSGGQPNDLGKIGDANVLDVRDEGDEILHLVDRKPSDAEVNCCINWPRRFDHMQQHTGQHLLSAMFQERFGLPTVSFHLGDEICTIDLRGVEPSAEFLEGAERAANQVVFEDRPVNVRYGTADEFAELGVRKEVGEKASCGPSKLRPRTCSLAAVRTLNAPGRLDWCWCGGAPKCARTGASNLSADAARNASRAMISSYCGGPLGS